MNGAGDEIRTRDINLGKVALYQLSYSRLKRNLHCALNASNLSNPWYQESGEATRVACGEKGAYPSRRSSRRSGFGWISRGRCREPPARKTSIDLSSDKPVIFCPARYTPKAFHHILFNPHHLNAAFQTARAGARVAGQYL